jgi:hypothetical protein
LVDDVLLRPAFWPLGLLELRLLGHHEYHDVFLRGLWRASNELNPLG